MKKILNILLTGVMTATLFGCSTIKETIGDANWDSYTTPIGNQTIQEDGLPTIQIEAEGLEYYQNDLDAILWCLKQQPDYLLKNIKTIYFQSSDAIDASLDGSIGVAYSTSDDLAVHLPLMTEDETTFTYEGEKTCSVSELWQHEFWHIYDFSHGKDGADILTNTQEFQNLYNLYSNLEIDENEEINTYMDENGAAEFFAECGVEYINEPDTLKTEVPDIYTYFEALPKD